MLLITESTQVISHSRTMIDVWFKSVKQVKPIGLKVLKSAISDHGIICGLKSLTRIQGE